MSTKVTPVLAVDEILRAEWVARVSALDLYVHELIAQRMLGIFEKKISSTQAYLRFQLSNETIERIQSANSQLDASTAFDLAVRNWLETRTFQDPEKIAEGIRLCSEVELWNEVALRLGANNSDKNNQAKGIKKDLSLIVGRRNKIAHEGDLQPTSPRQPWPINPSDLLYVRDKIEGIVRAIDATVK